MPYIAPETRKVLDPHIDALNLRLANIYSLDPMKAAGPLNYVLSRIVLGVLRDLQPEKPSYATLALFTGVLTNVSDELYRRVAAPYEDQKIAENGDLPQFQTSLTYR